jgi:hypothetical protein
LERIVRQHAYCQTALNVAVKRECDALHDEPACARGLRGIEEIPSAFLANTVVLPHLSHSRGR